MSSLLQHTNLLYFTTVTLWSFITVLPMNQVTLQNQSLIHLIPLFFHLSHIMIIKLTTACPKNGFIMHGAQPETSQEWYHEEKVTQI